MFHNENTLCTPVFGRAHDRPEERPAAPLLGQPSDQQPNVSTVGAAYGESKTRKPTYAAVERPHICRCRSSAREKH